MSGIVVVSQAVIPKARLLRWHNPITYLCHSLIVLTLLCTTTSTVTTKQIWLNNDHCMHCSLLLYFVVFCGLLQTTYQYHFFFGRTSQMKVFVCGQLSLPVLPLQREASRIFHFVLGSKFFFDDCSTNLRTALLPTPQITNHQQTSQLFSNIASI